MPHKSILVWQAAAMRADFPWFFDVITNDNVRNEIRIHLLEYKVSETHGLLQNI